MNKKQVSSIWILSDGLPGHVNQSLGISKALAEEFPHDHVMLTFTLRYKLLRPLMRLLANFFPFFLTRFTLSLFYRYGSLPTNPPALVISAGGNTLFASAAVAKIYRAPNVFSGTSKGYSHSLVRLVFTVTALNNSRNNVVLDLPPANINAAAGNKPKSSTTPLYALLVGGDGAGYYYKESDWQRLAEALQEISQRDGSKWLLTTSRRTGEKSEILLNSRLAPEICERAVWYGTKPAKVVKQFLQECDAVFCTEDSLTMISEAIYAHKPVITLQPEVMHPDENDAMALQKYADQAFIHRVRIKELSQLVLSDQEFCQNYPDIKKQIVQAVREYCL